MKYILIFLFFFIFTADVLRAQPIKSQYQQTIDSLLDFIKTTNKDTLFVNALNALSGQYINSGSYQPASEYAEKAQQLSLKLNYKKGIAVSFGNIGNIYLYQGNYEMAFINHNKALKIKEKIGDKPGLGNSYNNIGLIYYYQGDYTKALDYYFKSLKVREEVGSQPEIARSYANIGIVYESQGNYEKSMENNINSLKISDQSGDKRAVSNSYNNIGNIYINTGNQEKALENYLKSLHIKKQIFSESPNDIVNKKGIGNVYNNIGLIYMNTANYKKALQNYMAALEIREKTGDKLGLASSYNNIGLLYFALSDYEKALRNQQRSLKISEEIGDEQGIAASYLNIGSIYTKQNILDKSNQYLNNALTLFKKAGDKNSAKETYAVLSELNEKKGDYKKAFEYHQLFSNLKDTIFNEQSSKQIAEMNTKYDSEKKDNELIKKDAKISKQQAETEKQYIQRNAFIIGFILMLVLIFFIYKSYRQKQSANKLLEVKNKLIEKQKQLVDEKNEKITDSIQYAKRIQQAILPPDEIINSILPDSFIFFQPKDIVSGDFYWLSEKEDKLLIAVADCTGHGVPGAFMSMIGNTLLNEIVNIKNITKPNEILQELNKGVVNLLQQNSNGSAQDDGMDITILAIDKTGNEIEFAGANHFSYFIQQNKLKKLEGDVYSIGGTFGNPDINFTSQKLNITNGDILYLFTDGFIDQFGGEKNTKFLLSRFEQLLRRVQLDSMELQKEKISNEFSDWKGANKQLDDVLVFGIRCK